MADLAILQPEVLLGVIQKFDAPENLTLTNRLTPQPYPFPTAEWEIVQGSRAIAKPNVPNAEAGIVHRLGRKKMTSTFLYSREKKVFSPTTLNWIKQVIVNGSDVSRKHAEAAIIRDIRDLDTRLANLVEYTLWRALHGSLVFDTPEVQVSVDYGFKPTHSPNPGTSWASATPKQIVADLRAWKRLVKRDSGVAANEAFASELTIEYIFDSFATTGATNFSGGTLLTERMKDEYYRTGALPGFMGLQWNVQEAVYDSVGAAYTDEPSGPSDEMQFLDDNALILGNFKDNDPIGLMEGPSADASAPEGHTGKFSKTWIEPDPSNRQVLLENVWMPIVTRPEQIVVVEDVTSTT